MLTPGLARKQEIEMEDKCKCVHGHDRHGRETIRFCEPHAKEHSELHERAMLDYRKTNPVGGMTQDNPEGNAK